MTISYEESLRGRSVIDSTGRSIGEVAGLVLDLGSWHVQALRVKLHKHVAEEIGASHGMLRAARLDVPTDFVQDVRDTILLNGPIGTLRTLEQPAPA